MKMVYALRLVWWYWFEILECFSRKVSCSVPLCQFQRDSLTSLKKTENGDMRSPCSVRLETT